MSGHRGKVISAITLCLALKAMGTAGPALALSNDVCDRSRLSDNTQAFCDSLADVPADLPRFCFRPRIKEAWKQRECDRIRFADVPHYSVVRLTPEGVVRSIHLVDTESGRVLVRGYPYGVAFAVPDERDREIRVKLAALDSVLEGRPTPADITSSSSGYAAGLTIGWNESTGIATDSCLNYTIQTPSNNVEQASFSSNGVATSTAEQINVSATVKGSFDAFKANDTFSFSDAWQNSANSTNQFYNFYSLYTLSSLVDSTNPLNGLGSAALNAGAFSTTCGSSYLSGVPVGMVATISINYGSSSESTQTKVSDAFGGSDGLDGISAAVSAANSESDSSSYFTFNMVVHGGGSANAKLLEAYGETNSAGDAYYASCAAGNVSDCTQFSSNMGTGAANALAAFDTLVNKIPTSDTPDISFFAAFPGGVAGADAPSIATLPIPDGTGDALGKHSDQLITYLTLLNQIGTLNNRVTQLLALFQENSAFNVPQLLDLVGYLDRLENVYEKDRGTQPDEGPNSLLANFDACLAATDQDVDTACAPIINNEATTAFDFYESTPPTSACSTNDDCFFAEQNTIALQYATRLSLTDAAGSTFPGFADALYIDELPSFAAAGSDIPIAGQAGFVNFVDRSGGDPNDEALIRIVVLEPGKPLSTENLSPAVDEGSGEFTVWQIAGSGEVLQGVDDAAFTSNECTPTFEEPCAIDYEWVFIHPPPYRQ
jgi:hypothetical protein